MGREILVKDPKLTDFKYLGYRIAEYKSDLEYKL